MSTLPGRDTIKKPQLASCAFENVVGLLYKDVTASRVILRCAELIAMESRVKLLGLMASDRLHSHMHVCMVTLLKISV